MREKPRLSEAIEDHLAFLKAQGRAAGSLRNAKYTLRRFLLTSGDLFVASLGDRHIDTYMEVAGATRTPNTLAIDFAQLTSFFRWCVRKRYIPQLSNPMEGRKAPKRMPVEKRRVSVDQFPALLDAAQVSGPRDRMVVALGLYLFLRGSEVADLRVRDLHLNDGEISVRVWKTKTIDVMPISEELDAELRRWLRYYSNEQGEVFPHDPDERRQRGAWHLVPAQRPHHGTYDHTTGRLRSLGTPPLNPTRPIQKIEDIPKRALERIGFETRDENGKTLREGMHTLRRSGARAFFDSVRDEGYDGAMRDVQAMLHHSSLAMSEAYIGLTLDRVHRNERVRGRRMYGSRENVINLREAKEA